MLSAYTSEGQQASSLWRRFKVTSNHLAPRFIKSLLSIHMRRRKSSQDKITALYSWCSLIVHFLYLIIPFLITGYFILTSGSHITHRIQSDLSTATSALMKHFDYCLILIQILNTYSIISSNISMEGYYSKVKLKRLKLWNNIESHKRNLVLFQFRMGKWSQKPGFSVPHGWSS